MSKSKSPRTRWVCSKCGDGILGSQRPRRDSIVRYCLPCSEQEGKLVERVAPVLEKRRSAQTEKAKAKRVAKEQRDKQREHKRTHLTLWDAAGRIVEVNPEKAVREIAAKAGMNPGGLSWNRRSDGWNSGRAWGHRIHLSVGSRSLEAFCQLVAHELGHNKAGIGAGHSDRWRDAYEAIVKANWNVNGPYRGGVQHHRYAIDPEIERGLEYESENPKRKKPLIGKVIGAWESYEVDCRFCHGLGEKEGVTVQGSYFGKNGGWQGTRPVGNLDGHEFRDADGVIREAVLGVDYKIVKCGFCADGKNTRKREVLTT